MSLIQGETEIKRMKTLLNLVEFLASLEDLHMEHQEVADNGVFYHEALKHILGLCDNKRRLNQYYIELYDKEADNIQKQEKLKNKIKSIIDKFK